MVTAPGAGVAAIEHELLGTEPRQSCFLVESLGIAHQLRPAGRGHDVHLNHPWVRSDHEFLDAVIRWGGVAFDADRQIQLCGGVFNRSQQLQVGLQPSQWRHEDKQLAVTRLNAQRGADNAAVDQLRPLFLPVLSGCNVVKRTLPLGVHCTVAAGHFAMQICQRRLLLEQ